MEESIPGVVGRCVVIAPGVVIRSSTISFITTVDRQVVKSSIEESKWSINIGRLYCGTHQRLLPIPLYRDEKPIVEVAGCDKKYLMPQDIPNCLLSIAENIPFTSTLVYCDYTARNIKLPEGENLMRARCDTSEVVAWHRSTDGIKKMIIRKEPHDHVRGLSAELIIFVVTNDDPRISEEIAMWSECSDTLVVVINCK